MMVFCLAIEIYVHIKEYYVLNGDIDGDFKMESNADKN